jgi:hypothetical protein
MKVRSTDRRDGPAALKVLILHQQEEAAKLARAGDTALARAARSKLMVLLNQLDLSQHFALQS